MPGKRARNGSRLRRDAGRSHDQHVKFFDGLTELVERPARAPRQANYRRRLVLQIWEWRTRVSERASGTQRGNGNRPHAGYNSRFGSEGREGRASRVGFSSRSSGFFRSSSFAFAWLVWRPSSERDKAPELAYPKELSPTGARRSLSDRL
jgi:hypothetical protein